MIEIKKYGAIDIGSNAVRLLIGSVTTMDGINPRFKKTSLVRVPIRLGADVFVKNKVSDLNVGRLIDTMKSYQLLMQTHNVSRYRACATSAMRDAENGASVVKKIKEASGIQIEIIDGKDEAAIIAMTDLTELTSSNSSYLYVDVGGGSTEFTVYHKGKIIASKSFKLGTVRLLNNLVSEDKWNNVEKWIKKHTKNFEALSLIGSGGNINNIFKNSGKSTGKPLSYMYLVSYYQLLKSLTYDERVWELNLNHDRADVIVPAAKIFLSAMKWSNAQHIYVPKIGLADGIIKSLYNEDKKIIT
ncbi:Ppx/GppA phosphatase family protein [Aquimarina agarivorans]|uniref:Ppx/GppA phosphatase family protein n=1 Tax=Aquimarina agarivorans TaxID=980584 RepID=UPI000248F2FC|nr:exopolyphosphatase [Aquimarina agarivorans]